MASARRVVVKVGTRVLTHPGGRLALSRIHRLIETLSNLHADREVLLVSSGAVGLGQEALGLTAPPTELSLRQACASIGQIRLMEIYQRGFERMSVVTAQLLLIASDFEDAERFANLQHAVETLLARRVLPIINENDVVATEELRLPDGSSTAGGFGDNDHLSALVASRLRGDLLVLCTDVDGVYDRDPRRDPSANRLETVSNPVGLELGGPDVGGRGGMASKVSAARLASRAGCEVVIVSGMEEQALAQVFEGKTVGSHFPVSSPTPKREEER